MPRYRKIVGAHRIGVRLPPGVAERLLFESRGQRGLLTRLVVAGLELVFEKLDAGKGVQITRPVEIRKHER